MCAALLLCYFAATNLGMRLSDPISHVSPIWPATGISLGILLRFGWRRIFWMVALSICLEAAIYCFFTEDILDYGAMLGNICGPLAGAWLVERFAGGRRFLDAPVNVVRFVLLGVGSAGAISAIFGTVSMCFQGRLAWSAYSDVAVPWCISDMIGALLVTPLVLVWTTSRDASARRPRPPARPWELALLIITAFAFTQIAFSGWPLRLHRHPLEYLCIPVLLWAAFRFPGRGVVTVIAGVSGLAAVNTLAQRGPFSMHSHSLTLLQLYLGSTSLLALTTAAAVNERHAQEEALHTQGEALRLAAAEARRANEAKSDFLSRMSHELRTPLNAILGFAQLLEIEDPNPIQHESIQHILKGGRHLLSLINEVLDLARVEAGHLHIFLEPLDASTTFRESLAMVAPLIRQRGLNLVTQFSLEIPVRVVADQQRLKQILVNLLSNAVKFNREGGTIEASCSAHPVEDGTAVTVRLAVRDTGPGIAPEDQARIFNAFERGSADEHQVEGTGLGLALAKSLTVLMGGTLSLESTVSEGSTFILELPGEPVAAAAGNFLPVDEPAKEEPSLVADARPALRQVLYVEDDPASLSLVKHLLANRTDIEFRSAVRGDDGLSLARENPPDLMLLDLDLPGMHGRDVLAALRTDYRTLHVPVLVLSANTLPQSIDQALAAGATAYLTKPIDTLEFLRTADTHLRVRSPDHTQRIERRPAKPPFFTADCFLENSTQE